MKQNKNNTQEVKAVEEVKEETSPVVNAMTTTDATAIRTTFNFKNKELNDLSERIAHIFIEGVERNVELAKLFGTLLETECYKEDGFKSVQEYAAQTFGVDKSQAYALARVGKRFYNHPTDTTKRVIEVVGGRTSNLVELVGLSDEQLDAALNSNELNTDSTQKQLRQLTKNTKQAKDGKPTIVKTYDVTAVISEMRSGAVAQLVKKEGVAGSLLEAVGFDPNTDKLTKINDLVETMQYKDKPRTVKVGALYIAYTMDGRKAATIATKEHSKVKEPTKGKDKRTLADLDQNDPNVKAFLEYLAAQEAGRNKEG